MARLARAVRRGLPTMRIQAFLIAAAINLKRLAAALADVLATLCALLIRIVVEPVLLVPIPCAHAQVGRCSS